jgi:hypothetical protein
MSGINGKHILGLFIVLAIVLIVLSIYNAITNDKMNMGSKITLVILPVLLFMTLPYVGMYFKLGKYELGDM